MGEVQTRRKVEMPARRPNQRITGDDRESMRAAVLEGYKDGKSIRQLANDYTISIGLARNLLVEAGASFRPRGGRKGATAPDRQLKRSAEAGP